MFSFTRNHQTGCFSPLRSSHMQNKGTRALVPDSFLWKIHACSLPMIMAKYCNSSFEDKTNWLVWLYKNGKKREGMNLLESSYHINHLTASLWKHPFLLALRRRRRARRNGCFRRLSYRLLPKFLWNLKLEIAAVEALFRYFGPKRFRFFFRTTLHSQTIPETWLSA